MCRHAWFPVSKLFGHAPFITSRSAFTTPLSLAQSLVQPMA